MRVAFTKTMISKDRKESAKEYYELVSEGRKKNPNESMRCKLSGVKKKRESKVENTYELCKWVLEFSGSCITRWKCHDTIEYLCLDILFSESYLNFALKWDYNVDYWKRVSGIMTFFIWKSLMSAISLMYASAQQLLIEYWNTTESKFCRVYQQYYYGLLLTTILIKFCQKNRLMIFHYH